MKWTNCSKVQSRDGVEFKVLQRASVWTFLAFVLFRLRKNVVSNCILEVGMHLLAYSPRSAVLGSGTVHPDLIIGFVCPVALDSCSSAN